MSQFMTHLLYSSFSGAILIVAVFAIRLIVTKKAPRWIACVLWGMVGVRLLVPFSIESELSILPEIELSVQESQSEGEVSEQSRDSEVEESQGESITESQGESITESVEHSEPTSAGESSHESDEVSKDTASESSDEESVPTVVLPPFVGGTSEEPSNDEPADTESSAESMDSSTEDSTEESVFESMTTSDAGGESAGSADEQNVADRTGAVVGIIWACGMGALLLYAAVQYLLLRRRVAVFSVDKGGIRRCESIDTPFVLGFFRPHIYLPFGLTEEDETYIIAHERAHIRRFDHMTKTVAFAALALHWFNPLVWLAFVLFCRDIEYACDEKVVRNLSGEERKAYASALLSASVRK